MLKLGKFNLLRVTKQTSFGVYLDAANYGEILLPKRYVPRDCIAGNWLKVFVYLDSEDRLIATTDTPYVQVGECACLKAVSLSPFGAFLDWGLPKDLLVPRREQAQPMQAGKPYVVYVYVDERTETIVGSSRLELFLNEFGAGFSANQPVELMIYAQTDIGFKAVINGTHLGLLYANEVYQPLRVGQKVNGFIKQIRPDKKIDLILQQTSVKPDDALGEKIIEHLKAAGGRSTITDKSPPDVIYQTFQVSKAHYKRALGLLFKQRRIQLTKTEIELLSHT